MLRQSLDLSDAQAKELEPVLKEQQDKLNALRRDTSLSRREGVARLKEIQQTADSKIKVQLTPEQAEKWQQVRANPSRLMGQHGQSTARTNGFTLAPNGATRTARRRWDRAGRLCERGRSRRTHLRRR